jgi:hypothetical protein
MLRHQRSNKCKHNKHWNNKNKIII